VKRRHGTSEQAILELIKENPKISMQTITKTTGLSKRGVEYQLNRLKDA
jgi:predicted HTH transcriptional regulator